ncbi:hypothetical protein C7M84_019356 [Penaeus vannamei]|uniref:Integrase catalytic domain-containing protein n=1 Tax=Penaeus vannamei TaxID=6689 RepID=A0A3R7LTW8_PENVA|nr:hypothetical protein C7M84_019356 [Penaeus vannamei]
MLRASLVSSGSEWDQWTPIIQMAINSTFHSTLGHTPHFVVYGEDKRLPYELLEQNPRPAYTDDYVRRAVRKKQEIYRTAQQTFMIRERQNHPPAAQASPSQRRPAGSSRIPPGFRPGHSQPKTVTQSWFHFDSLKLSRKHYEDEFFRANPSDHATSQEPGAIVSFVGSYVEVSISLDALSSYVEVSISLDALSSFYISASTHLSLIEQYTHAISTDASLTAGQISSLLSFLSLSHADLASFKDRLPRPRPRRQRRGLFNFLGDVISYLFGIATHDELDARFDNYERTLGSVVGKFKGTISDTVNSLNNVTRQLSIYTDTNSQLIAHEQHFTLLLAHVSLYQSRVRLFVDYFNSLTHDLSLQSMASSCLPSSLQLLSGPSSSGSPATPDLPHCSP